MSRSVTHTCRIDIGADDGTNELRAFSRGRVESICVGRQRRGNSLEMFIQCRKSIHAGYGRKASTKILKELFRIPPGVKRCEK